MTRIDLPPQTSTQEEIFAKVGRPLAHAVISGYNATCFAYGQTGSGKVRARLAFACRRMPIAKDQQNYSRAPDAVSSLLIFLQTHTMFGKATQVVSRSLARKGSFKLGGGGSFRGDGEVAMGDEVG